ncbi:MAG: hypothetical protein K2X44_01780, partial [Magnetospirillum sp.]|nr:hypothetical protein [Magnetospirillum sp.]
RQPRPGEPFRQRAPRAVRAVFLGAERAAQDDTAPASSPVQPSEAAIECHGYHRDAMLVIRDIDHLFISSDLENDIR